MPDTKITALAAISTVDPAVDPLAIVDVSDTSMAASGTTKKVTINQILGASGTATLASATITGDLTAARLIVTGATVPTNGMYLPSANTLAWAINSAEALRLNSTANLVLKGGTVGANGVGLTFPATQVASSDANCLDDYEEGTWTGTLGGATTNPTTPVTATGRYTKIGRQVSIQIHFSNVDTTGASGQIKVSGSPFSSNSSVGSTGSIMMSSIGSFTGSPVAFIGTSTTEIELYTSSSAAGIGFVNHNAGASRSLWINLTYTV